MIYVLFFIIVLLTNIIQGITGFAGTVLAMPFSIMLLGIEIAKPVLNILTIVACLIIVLKSYKHIIWKEFLKITFIMLMGVFIGEYIYNIFPVDTLLTIYAVFIIVIALKGMFIKKEHDLNETILIGIILGAGVIHGMFISGGPLLIIYAVKRIKDKESFRATLSPVWIVLNTYILIRQSIGGIITYDILGIVLITIPALIIGVIIGNRLAEKMSQETFLKLSYVLLLISGVSLIL
ncbi:MAG: sulfite exporter TauE/SafE family protein [Clostridium sp.]|uniref:sulfite exporter TauE/SafE family protein n=1 Tax=Clostridium sp. TaxID=1506 RepID=UPI0030505148